jgi:CRP-like cAMP-binding protein
MIEVLRQTWLLSDLSAEEAEAVLKRSNLNTRHKGDRVIETGAKNDSIWIVLSGRCGVVAGEGPAMRTVAEIPVGGLFGEMSWLDGQSASASIVALEKSELIRIRFDDLDAFLAQHPDVHINMLRKFAINLSHRLRGR